MKTQEKFVAVVSAMRQAQKSYFQTCDSDALEEAKRLEREVERMIEEMTDRQQKLFG